MPPPDIDAAGGDRPHGHVACLGPVDRNEAVERGIAQRVATLGEPRDDRRGVGGLGHGVPYLFGLHATPGVPEKPIDVRQARARQDAVVRDPSVLGLQPE